VEIKVSDKDSDKVFQESGEKFVKGNKVDKIVAGRWRAGDR
jgi:hypothetical protein